MSAVTASGDVFNVYVTPKVPISMSAQQITGIVNTSAGLTVNGQLVPSVPIKEGLKNLTSWLEQYPDVTLVAHNGRKFDFPVLMTSLVKTELVDKFMSSVVALVDSLSVFRKLHPKLESHKQEDLARILLKETYPAHDAVQDVIALQKLISNEELSTSQLLTFTFPPAAVYNQWLFNKEKLKNIESLSVLLYNGVMKAPTAENVAGSGLNLTCLRTIFRRDGEDGLSNTFTGKNKEGQPRVTSCKRTLETVIPKLVEFFQHQQ